MKRCHDMPFGAAIHADGSAHFRLWAPAARRVELVLRPWDGASAMGLQAEVVLPMRQFTEDWFELRLEGVAAGSRYRHRIDGTLVAPDPASRFNPGDVHGDSELIDPRAHDWQDEGWHGRPWHEAVIQELHVGTYSACGDYVGVMDRLAHLADLGITAIELMPLSDFPGRRNWGYDGVLPYAPDARYGRPEELKRLVDTAHAAGIMVLLDVVYNHFGPEGNYLHASAPGFFTDRHHTPWGAAINFDGDGSRTVRQFFIHNALYWLEEYHLDGLRLDAVHAIPDDSQPDFLTELAEAVRCGPGATRHVHLVLENDGNAAHRLNRDSSGHALTYDAQWNDDFHHAFHVLLTGEADGYYADYAGRPLAHLARCLTQGFSWQGEPSPFRNGGRRGEPSDLLPPTAFVAFLQNHDQIGNRAFGERLVELAEPQGLEAALIILLLAPQIPLLFMGEEFAATTPFQFFCDFGADLRAAVREGRRREFGAFERFRDPALMATIPDPEADQCFIDSQLDWTALEAPAPARRLALCRQLIGIRQREIIPLLATVTGAVPASARMSAARGLAVSWTFTQGVAQVTLRLRANLGSQPEAHLQALEGTERILFSTVAACRKGVYAPWSVVWSTRTGPAG